MEPVCLRVHDSPKPSLLTLPFPFPNYFCNVAPWHDEVQTFFDTSTEQTVAGLMEALKAAPPHTIAYQRQMLNLLMHERIYNRSRPLPHRALDRLIVDEIASGAWSVTRQVCLAESDWVLIETVPRAALPAGSTVPFNADPYRCVRRKDVDALESGSSGDAAGGGQ